MPTYVPEGGIEEGREATPTPTSISISYSYDMKTNKFALPTTACLNRETTVLSLKYPKNQEIIPDTLHVLLHIYHFCL